jgi:hypothetical protein
MPAKQAARVPDFEALLKYDGGLNAKQSATLVYAT